MKLEQKILYIVLILLFAGIVSCRQEPRIVNPLLVNNWLESKEEDSGNVRVFRTSDYNFPPSRYRQNYYLKDNNVCEYNTLLPQDGWIINKGEWSYEEQTKRLTIMDENKKVVLDCEVLELTNKYLKIKNL